MQTVQHILEPVTWTMLPPIATGDIFLVTNKPISNSISVGTIIVCIDITSDPHGHPLLVLLCTDGIKSSYVPNEPLESFWIQRCKSNVK
jgi:hypothetical protein